MTAVLALLSPAALFAQASPVGWNKVVINKEVTVYLPPGAKPNADNKKQAADSQLWIFSLGATVFEVEVMPNYEKGEPGITPDRAMAEYISGTLQEAKRASIKRQRDITINGWPGLDDLLALEMKVEGNFAMLEKTYAVAGSLYSVSVMYASEFGRPASAEPFLNSLEIKAAAKAGPLTTPGPTFTPFAPTGGGFTIGMPSTPIEEEVPLSKGDKKSLLHRFTALYGNRAYIANYVAFPPEAPEMTQDEKNQILAMLVDTVVKGMEAKAVGQPTTIRHDDLEIVTVECARPDGVVCRVQATVAQRRIFVMVMACPAGHAGAPDIDTFFNSFKLLPPAPKSK